MATRETGVLVDEELSAYQRTLDWLYNLNAAKGIDFKLDRMAAALRELGNPHRNIPAIHIAGTNGKGSVAATLHAILTHAGYRVGLYVSPHLVRFTERIRVGHDEVSPTAVVRLAAEVRKASERAGVEPTFFELVTLMAFVHFACSEVDVGVIEVGLGGRLDATNMVDPLATVITTIGIDHTQFLGDTIASIAAEKAGIIKPGRPVVVGRLGAEAGSIIEEVAARQEAPVYRQGRDYDWSWEVGLRFDGLAQSWRGLVPVLRGHHQLENAATALATLAVLADRLPVSDRAVRDGLGSVDWPGRLQVVPGAPTIILDGAHNLDGLLALRRELPQLCGSRDVHLLFAVMKDKDWEPMVDALAPVCASAILTEVLPPRSLSAGILAERFSRYCLTIPVPNLSDAWREVLEKAGPADVVLITGSLFLVGAVSELLAHRLTLSDTRAVEVINP